MTGKKDMRREDLSMTASFQTVLANADLRSNTLQRAEARERRCWGCRGYNVYHSSYGRRMCAITILDTILTHWQMFTRNK